VHGKLDEVERIERPGQPVADFLHDIRLLQLGKEREHAGTSTEAAHLRTIAAATLQKKIKQLIAVR
jgi:hypothetical protein